MGRRMNEFRVLPAGDTALVVEFGSEIDQRLNARVLALARHVNDADIDGVIETVPTFRSLMIHFDPLVVPTASLTARVAELANRSVAVAGAGRFWRLPVCYDAAFALDLDDAAGRLNLSPAQLIERHSTQTYHVYMLGFLPGQAYMGDLPPELALPRRATPRAAVPAGSLAIAMSMTCIFPMETPCGWHVVGRSPIPLFQVSPTPQALLAPGDKVRLMPISRREHDDLVGKLGAAAIDPDALRIAS
jgi:KipI family sensor histidine kinase inhibitor